jgi:hypothetical protein
LSLEGGWFSALRTVRLYPKNILVLFLRGWVDPGYMELSDVTEKFPSYTTGIDPGTFWIVVQCLNHYATPGPNCNVVPVKIFRVKVFPWSNFIHWINYHKHQRV